MGFGWGCPTSWRTEKLSEKFINSLPFPETEKALLVGTLSSAPQVEPINLFYEPILYLAGISKKELFSTYYGHLGCSSVFFFFLIYFLLNRRL